MCDILNGYTQPPPPPLEYVLNKGTFFDEVISEFYAVGLISFSFANISWMTRRFERFVPSILLQLFCLAVSLKGPLK